MPRHMGDDNCTTQGVRVMNVDLENNLLVFFTGITRAARNVLKEQKANSAINVKPLNSLVKLTSSFEKKLVF